LISAGDDVGCYAIHGGRYGALKGFRVEITAAWARLGVAELPTVQAQKSPSKGWHRRAFCEFVQKRIAGGSTTRHVRMAGNG
jgi:hypothetical protein